MSRSCYNIMVWVQNNHTSRCFISIHMNYFWTDLLKSIVLINLDGEIFLQTLTTYFSTNFRLMSLKGCRSITTISSLTWTSILRKIIIMNIGSTGNRNLCECDRIVLRHFVIRFKMHRIE